MSAKRPTDEELERKLEELDIRLARHDTLPPPEDRLDFYNIGPVDRSPLATSNHGRTAEDILAAPLPLQGERSGVMDDNSPLPEGEGPGVREENPKFQNEIEIESNPVPEPRRKRGQRTKRGQLVASRNATRHGIMSNAPVVDDFETMDSWEEHLQGIHDSINPQSPLEESLAYRLAGILWRLNRVIRHETASIKRDVANRRSDWQANEDAGVKRGLPPGDPEDLQRRLDLAAIPESHASEKIIKYETSLHRQSLQLLHELEAFAARRAGQPTPLARLDISGPPA